jgi:predicted amidohydrolase YtcJ
MVNSAGARLLGLDSGARQPGIERDKAGRATGRLFRLDAWLRKRIGTTEPPSLAAVSHRLARHGVTGVTDATATNGAEELRAFGDAADRGELKQRVLLMGSAALPRADHPRVKRGAVKVLLDERDLPDYGELRETFAAAHRSGRAVAVHCVTRSELVLAAAALEAAGGHGGDRIEHAGVAPPDVLPILAALPLTVVTQPNFIRERGDAYLEDVDPRDRPWLYRGRALLDASIPLGGGTDAPFGRCDPFAAMQSAVDRRTESGATIGPDENLTPEQALGLFTSPAADPGGPQRRVAVGAPADLCLLTRPWADARRELSSDLVAATLIAGQLVWQRD